MRVRFDSLIKDEEACEKKFCTNGNFFREMVTLMSVHFLRMQDKRSSNSSIAAAQMRMSSTRFAFLVNSNPSMTKSEYRDHLSELKERPDGMRKAVR